jgi:hypothetical protein
MKKLTILFTACIIISLISNNTVTAQNTVITDDENYTPHSSAMLDVYSLNKGLLVPRLTSTQRNAISAPADGLLVYDINADAYYYFANSAWHTVDAPSLWSENNDIIFITGDGKRYGVGTNSPLARLTVQGDATIGPTDPLFEVKNSVGDVIFAVYENEVQVNFKEPAKGNKGGFAVGGLSGGKDDPTEYLRVTPDSVRIYINESAKGNKGGFAVGGLSGGKETGSNYLDLTPDNYFIGHNAGANTEPDGYFYGMHNSFIGFESGLENTTGHKNVFIGYYTGRANTEGFNNVFIGNNTGSSNLDGYRNVFLGTDAGANNENGYLNTFIGNVAGTSNIGGYANTIVGNYAGYSNESGNLNVFIGQSAGMQNVSGSQNVCVGQRTGYWNKTGTSNTYVGDNAAYNDTISINNTFLGAKAGYNNKSGSNNVFLGYQAGYTETESNKLYISNGLDSDLIYGEFDTKLLKFNANVGVNTNPSTSYQLHVEDLRTSNDAPAIYGVHDVTDGYGVGVQGRGRYMGIRGYAYTLSGSSYGLYGLAWGTGTGTRYGVYGYAAGGATNWAGYFIGNVEVTGTVSKSASVTKIDHPEDPENKYLIHSNVGSPDMKNIYDGTVILDASGKAIVELPSYFNAFNKEFRYQLTAIGKPAPSIYIEKEIENNEFVIAGGEPGMKVSWQVTGNRKDPYAQKNRLGVEQEKLPENRGKYMNPASYDKAEEYSISFDKKNVISE